MYENYHDTPHSVIEGSIPIKEIYGKFPDFMEVMQLFVIFMETISWKFLKNPYKI